MDWPSRHSCEKRAFGEAVGVKVRETCHGLVEDRVQLPMLYVVIDPIYAAFCRAMIRHLIGRLKRNVSEEEALATHAKLVIDNVLSTTHSHVRLGMIRIDKMPTFYRQLRQH